MKSVKAFLKSFVYAFRGVLFPILNERNMRVHFCFLGYMAFFLIKYDFFIVSKTEGALLALAAALVITAEYINTAVERAVDTAAKGEISESARIAKDTAAGAVLVSAIFAVIIGLIILLQPKAFVAMFEYYAANPLSFILFLISFVIALCFVFISPKKYLKFLRSK